MVILISSFIIFLFINFLIILLIPKEYQQFIFSILTPLYLFLCQKFYQTQKEKELEKFKYNINQEFSRYQSKINQELEFYKSKLENSNLVTKMQYELEFSIYKELYSDVMVLYQTYHNSNTLYLIEKINLKTLQYQPFIENDIFNKIAITTTVIKENQQNTNKIFVTKILFELSENIKNRIESMQIIN